MPKISYVEKSFQSKSLDLIDFANDVIDEYLAQGYDLTLRQLYYQMVARDVIENTPRSYDRLGSLINDARLAGLIDWNAIVDRTRNLRSNSHWDSPKSIIRSARASFKIDLWANQEYRPEVWVEKDALIGVIESICQPLDVPYFACRGYTSQSEMWSAGQRIFDYMYNGFKPIIFHLGDHDPSGIDMSRDIENRLNMFVNHDLRQEAWSPDWYDGYIQFNRLALNYDQIRRFNPPPNPAKMTDSRATEYVARFGRSSWELDALSPTQIADIVNNAILDIRDEGYWEASGEVENRYIEELREVENNWNSVVTMIEQLKNQRG